MLLVKTSDGHVKKFPYTLGELRRENPNVSFPSQVDAATLANYGVFIVVSDAQPNHDPLVQTVVRDSKPRKEANTGRWVVGYTVKDKHLDVAQNAVRQKRNRLLSDTDWRALSDVALSQDWADYRQALRDITKQAGFPYSIQWPTEPE